MEVCHCNEATERRVTALTRQGKAPPEYIYIYIYIYIHYRSNVWGHPDNFVSSMKTHTFIYQMN